MSAGSRRLDFGADSNNSKDTLRNPLEIQYIPSEGDKALVYQNPANRANLIKVWIFFGTYISIVIIILIFFFYFLFGHTLDQQRMYAVLNSVSGIMKEPPIAELLVTNQTCPTDYEHMTLGEWPGTDHGCYYADEESVVPGNCVQEKKGIGVQPVVNQSILLWEHFSFCVRRYRSMAIEYTDNCPYGFKRCGVYLCIPEQEKCPVTAVYWIKERPSNVQNKEIVMVDTENNQYIMVERSGYKEPLVRFSTSYNGVPCLDVTSAPFPEGMYPLLNVKHSCQYGQNFEAKIIDTKPEKDFLVELPHYDQIKKLALIDEYAEKNTLYLVSVSRFKLRPIEACANPEQFFIMGRVTEKVNEITKTRNLFIISMLFGVIIIVFLTFDQRKIVRGGFMSIDLSMSKTNGVLVFLLCILLSLLTLCSLWIVSPKIALIKDYRESLKTYIGYNCFMNTFINTALNNFANGPPYEAELFFRLIIIIWCLSLIPILIITFEKFCKKPENTILIDNRDEYD